MGDMFQQPILEVENPAVFEPVKAAIEAAFAPPSVGKFLDNETVKSGYEQLGNSDRGQIRELYLRSVEQVAPELRKKYLKVYAYY